eukprot:SAG31_NODE_63_length_28659_cov_23.074685_4_plen_76_part_00
MGSVATHVRTICRLPDCMWAAHPVGDCPGKQLPLQSGSVQMVPTAPKNSPPTHPHPHPHPPADPVGLRERIRIKC